MIEFYYTANPSNRIRVSSLGEAIDRILDEHPGTSLAIHEMGPGIWSISEVLDQPGLLGFDDLATVEITESVDTSDLDATVTEGVALELPWPESACLARDLDDALESPRFF